MRRRYVLAYDVRDQKRLAKCARVARRYGDCLQYSIFVCDLSQGEIVKLLDELDAVINQREDRVVLIEVGEASGRRLRRRLTWLGERPGALLDDPRSQIV